jgi:hypothetical protein
VENHIRRSLHDDVFRDGDIQRRLSPKGQRTADQQLRGMGG